MPDIYRDRTEGVAARRQELLRRRRDELVTTPHAVRRVVVGRSARIAASLAIGVVGAALLAAAAAPGVVAVVASALPRGAQPAVLSTLLGAAWVIGVGAWWIARARAEHRFAVAMSRYVLPGADAAHDVERLSHEHPDEAARAMAHRLEVRSAALPVLAAALLVPATAIYVLQAIDTRGVPVMSDLETNLAASAGALSACAFAGLVAAVAMTSQLARRPTVAWVAWPVAGLATALAGIFIGDAITAWALLATAVIAATVAVVVGRLRVERELIAADDPAAGSELFTLRGAVRQLRATWTHALAATRRAAHSRRARVYLTAGAAAVATLAFTAHHARAHDASPQLANMAVVELHSGTEAEGLDSGYHVEVAPDGRLKIDVVLNGTAPIDVPALADLDAVPPSWRATVTVELSAATPGSVRVTPFPGDPTLLPTTLEPGIPSPFVTEVCDGRTQPLGLHVEARHATDGPQHVTLFVEPVLAMAHCY